MRFQNTVVNVKNGRSMTKPTTGPVHSAKTRISLIIQQVWSVSSLWTLRIAKDATNSKDSDQTWQMLRLIWVFSGCTGHFVCFAVLWLQCLLPYMYVFIFAFRIIWAGPWKNLSWANNKGAAQPPEDMFCRVVAHICLYFCFQNYL